LENVTSFSEKSAKCMEEEMEEMSHFIDFTGRLFQIKTGKLLQSFYGNVKEKMYQIW